MKPDLILLGNSPFIHQVNIPALLDRHTVIGFNGMGQHYPVDAVFCFDKWFDPGKSHRVFHPHYIQSKHPASRPFYSKSSPRPIMTHESKDGFPVLGFKYFTPSAALNWALLQGFKRVYLVGIDHVESDTRFAHHDGADCRSELTPAAHQGFKQYVYQCAKHAEIFQCNPAVRDGWQLPFKDVSDLYVPQPQKTQ